MLMMLKPKQVVDMVNLDKQKAYDLAPILLWPYEVKPSVRACLTNNGNLS